MDTFKAYKKQNLFFTQKLGVQTARTFKIRLFLPHFIQLKLLQYLSMNWCISFSDTQVLTTFS